MAKTNQNSPCNMHEALVSYLYGEASAEEIRQVQTHLKQCSACAAELDGFEGVRRMLQHWKIEDVPAMRVVTEAHRSVLGALKEIFAIAPIWAKVAGVAFAALSVLAIMGTNISIGPGGVSFRADLLRRSNAVAAQVRSPAAPAAVPTGPASLTKEQVQQIVATEMASQEKKQEQEMATAVALVQAEAKRTHSSDVAKLALKLQEQRDHLKMLERDVDRHEGLDVADILFSPGRASTVDVGAPEGARE